MPLRARLPLSHIDAGGAPVGVEEVEQARSATATGSKNTARRDGSGPIDPSADIGWDPPERWDDYGDPYDDMADAAGISRYKEL